MEVEKDNPAFVRQALTRRELAILAHLANGRSSQEIALLETLAHSSVKWYIHQVYVKLGVNKRSQAVARARQMGILQAEPSIANNSVAVKNNLPIALTHFFGREAEIPQIEERLKEWRMVTLTGPGGVGKTRLSLAVAGRLLANFPDGVWFIELAPIVDPELVPAAVGSILCLHEESGQPILEQVKSFLANRTALLLLDNCEHLLDGCARLADSLLHACSQLKILATSREPLGVTGEAIFSVPSLPFPKRGSTVTPESIDTYAAVCLFTDRARQTQAHYQVTAQNAAALASICQCLDGIPLAIELAAARMSVLSAEELNARLNEGFHMLIGGSRTALPRQQTLQATIEWSYRLLTERERRLLRRLAIFTGGWNLAAAEGICSGESLEAPEILDLLANLVNKSMAVVAGIGSRGTRYRMLETIREYAHEKLGESGEQVDFQHRHLIYFVELAETIEPYGRAPNQVERRVLEDDFENIRLALGTGLKQDAQAGLRLACALWPFWGFIGRDVEGLHWLRAYLDHPDNAARTALRGRALWRYSSMVPLLPGSEAAVKESLDIFQELDDQSGQGCAQHSWGLWALLHENFPAARQHLEAAFEVFDRIQDHWWMAETQLTLAVLARNQGDMAAQLAGLEKALLLFRGIGDQLSIARVLALSAECKIIFQGDLRSGYTMLQESLEIFKQNGYESFDAYYHLAEVLCWQGEYERADQACAELMDIACRSDYDAAVPMVNFFTGRFTCLQGKLEAGIRLMEQAVNTFKAAGSLNAHMVNQQTLLMELAFAHAVLGHVEQAEVLVADFEYLFRDAQYQPRLMRLLGFVALKKGLSEESARYFREGLRLADQLKWRLDALLSLEGCAYTLSLNGKSVEAARLLSAAAEFRTRIGAPVFLRDQPLHQQITAALKERLGEPGYASARAEGQSLGFEQACRQAYDLPK